jgi:hypothetical protein
MVSAPEENDGRPREFTNAHNYPINSKNPACLLVTNQTNHCLWAGKCSGTIGNTVSPGHSTTAPSSQTACSSDLLNLKMRMEEQAGRVAWSSDHWSQPPEFILKNIQSGHSQVCKVLPAPAHLFKSPKDQLGHFVLLGRGNATDIQILICSVISSTCVFLSENHTWKLSISGGKKVWSLYGWLDFSSPFTRVMFHLCMVYTLQSIVFVSYITFTRNMLLAGILQGNFPSFEDGTEIIKVVIFHKNHFY